MSTHPNEYTFFKPTLRMINWLCDVKYSSNRCLWAGEKYYLDVWHEIWQLWFQSAALPSYTVLVINKHTVRRYPLPRGLQPVRNPGLSLGIQFPILWVMCGSIYEEKTCCDLRSVQYYICYCESVLIRTMAWRSDVDLQNQNCELGVVKILPGS